MTQKSVMNSFIAVENKMARLKQKTLKLAREEYLKNQMDKDESQEIKMEKVGCPKCRGDGNETSATHIQDLCPADRKKITQLISELARCTQEKHRVAADLAVSTAENEALRNQFQLLNNQYEDDKNKLRSQLSNKKTEMSKLKLQTSHSLKLLTEQIVALENQSTKLVETVKDLLNDKISLQDALVKQQMTVQILEAKIDRMKDNHDTEKRLFGNQQIKNQCSQKCDRDCQTEKAHLQAIEAGPRLEVFDVNPESHRLLRNTQVKSKRDLDEPTLEGILLRDLFFKHPSIDENEGLDLFPRLPRN